MYGKIFTSMYDGTLHGNWEALVTFQQLIVIADDVGTVDVTPSSLSSRTGIPIDIIEKGISVLESDDPYSRTPGHNGKRIERLDDHRPWGWRIINYLKYRKLASYEEKKKADRERLANKRKGNKNNDVARCRKVSQGVADVAHTDTDTDTDKKKRKIFSSDSCEYRLAKLLYDLIINRNPEHKKPNSQVWAKHIDLMIRVDGRKPEKIQEIIRLSQEDEFWQNNILSTASLRSKFDQLTLKLKPATPPRQEKDF